MIPFLSGEKLKEIIGSKKLSMVWFTVPNCAPCRAIAPRVEEVSKKYSAYLQFYRINIEEFAEMAQQNKVTNTPTLIFFKDGKEVFRLDAFPSKEEIIETIEKLRR